MSAAAVRGLSRRIGDGGRLRVRVSLAQIAALLIDIPHDGASTALLPETESDLDDAREVTDWGTARRLRSPLEVGVLHPVWGRPARALGIDLPEWLP